MFNELENNDENENFFFDKSICSPNDCIYSQHFTDNDFPITNSNDHPLFQQSPLIALATNQDEPFPSNNQHEDSNSLENSSRPSETKLSSNDVFCVSKDLSVRKRMNQRLKEKAERIKLILSEKQSRTNAQSKKALTFAEKQEKKILRNRMSAQRSRDRQKSKMISLVQVNTTLIEENDKLKQQVNQIESVVAYLTDNIRQCSHCHSLLNSINHQSVVYISDNDSVSSGGYRNWLGGLSVVGLLCLVGLFMLFNSPTNVLHSKKVIRQLEAMPMPYLDYEPTTNNESYFPIIKYSEEANPIPIDSSYQKEFTNKLNETSYSLRSQIMEIINRNYPIEDNSSNEKAIIQYALSHINSISALREQFLIELFNKIQLTQALKEHSTYESASSTKKKNLQIEKSKRISYDFPICYNPDHIEYKKKKLPQLDDSYPLTYPTAIELAKQKQEMMNDNVQTVYVSDYIVSSSDVPSDSFEQINFEAIIAKLKKSNSSASNGECLYFQLLFPVNNSNRTEEEPLISSTINPTINNRNSLYEVGCKVLSISKIGK